MDKKYKNIYMFKNPIRHFLNSENINYPTFTLDINEIDEYAPTIPLKFTIRKYYGKEDQRDLLLPNFLNYALLYSHIQTFPNFYDVENISVYSRMSANLETGDFKAYEYQKNVETDLLKLTVYDKLYRYDIKSFYNSIYTHDLVKYTEFHTRYSNNNDRYISWLDDRRTPGIIAGSYASLYLAELYLKELMDKLKEKLKENNIDCVINNFSDDIYIFSYAENENRIREIFNEVLSSFSLENNSEKYESYDYISYNNENIVTKYWKAVIRKQLDHEEYIDNMEEKDEPKKYNLNFTNQLIYRINKLNDPKLSAIFIKNFFKSNYFTFLDPNNYNLFNENLHQLLYMMKCYPECILYIMPKLKEYSYAKMVMEKYFLKLLKTSLGKKYYEEQIYVFYGMYLLYGDSLTLSNDIVDLILKTDNQILKSYVIMYFLPSTYNASSYLREGEENWFLNYHIILKINDPLTIDSNIEKYLIPNFIKNKLIAKPTDTNYLSKKSKYTSFYKDNLTANITFIKKLSLIESEIKEYLQHKMDEKETDSSKASILLDF